MTRDTSIARAVRHALWMSAMAAATASIPTLGLTQETPASDSETRTVVVTGSRIARDELESPTPVQVLSSQDLQLAGSPNVSDVLRELPQVGISTLSGTNSNFLTSSAGVNNINLRNLDPSRTLVLVNGRRFVAGVSGTSSVDFNMIPTDFIDRVEIVTGGASAVYGSEAIAGVVNVILKKKFDGVSFRGQAGQTGESDSQKELFSLTMGSGLAEDRGNILLNFQYDKDKGLWSRDRAISRTDRFLADVPTFSSYVPQGLFFGADTYTFRNNALVAGFDNPVDGFNRNALRRISVPLDRGLFTGLFDFNVAEHHTAFAEVTYGQTQTDSAIEPFALDVGDVYQDGTGIPLTNAFIPQQILDDINTFNNDPTTDPADVVTNLGFRRRLSDLAIRSSSAKRQTVRAVAGLRGDIVGDWTYEGYYMWGRTTDDQTGTGQVNVANLRFALDTVTDGGGNVTCRDLVAVAQGCVPVNLFGLNSISPAAAKYVDAPQTRNATITEEIVSAVVQGPIMKLPAGDLSLAVGLEHRREKSEELNDALTQQGLNGGNLIPNVIGTFDVSEAFVELQVPILADAPFAHDFRASAAYRLGDYSTVDKTASWKGGLEWAPNTTVRLRGVYAEATRAPNIGELFSAPAETFPSGITDPCDGVTAATAGAIADTCRAIPGVSQAIAANGVFEYGFLDFQQINGFDGGNPNLTEETAKTKTLGFVLTPTFVPGLAVTVDWFDIKIDDAIDTIPRQTSIDSCLATGDAVFCDNVTRLATGKLARIDANNINVATIRTAGVDTSARYRFAFGETLRNSTLDVGLAYTYLSKLEKIDFPGADLNEQRGQLSGDGRLGAGFKNKASLDLNYGLGAFTLNWRLNYLSKIVDTLGANEDPDLGPFNKVPAYYYSDVQARYGFGANEQYKVYIGADNLFDKKPPNLPMGMASSITGAETAADTYDPFGRFIYGGVEVKF